MRAVSAALCLFLGALCFFFGSLEVLNNCPPEALETSKTFMAASFYFLVGSGLNLWEVVRG